MSCFRKLSVLLLTVFATLAQGHNAYAEPPQLFERVPGVEADLTPAQQDALSKLQKWPNVISAEVTRIDPNVLKTANQFNLNLTRDTSLTIKKFQSGDQLSYVSESPNITIDQFTVDGDRIDGQILGTDDNFRILALGHGLHVLVKLDPSKLPPCRGCDQCPDGFCCVAGISC